MQQADISKVRASVHQQCGNPVMIQLDRGRNRVDIQRGVIQHAYPSVFIHHSCYHSVTVTLLQKILE